MKMSFIEWINFTRFIKFQIDSNLLNYQKLSFIIQVNYKFKKYEVPVINGKIIDVRLISDQSYLIKND